MPKPSIHFTGVGGTGMSALAQIHAMAGDSVTGSDRLADKNTLGEAGQRLESAGIRIFPQDGSGISPNTSRVVISTAIEGDNLDLTRAAELKIPVVHRADELAALCQSRRAVAVAGTSGKSTVTAMVFHILQAAGLDPSLVAGANIPSLRRKGLLGNAWRGKSDLLVLEADESDGTLTRYKPELGVLLNISKDHKDLSELMTLFKLFAKQSRRFILNADQPALAALQKGAITFGFFSGDIRAKDLKLTPSASEFTIEGEHFYLPVAGRHNAENALAAAAVGRELGVNLKQSAAALASFEGVGRRFERLGKARGVEVIDDFAHNPEKVRAALSTAALGAKRLLAVFQLHGFAPARFLKDEFIEAFAQGMRPQDILWLPEIYYAGGTAAKDISALDYAKILESKGKTARYVAAREGIVAQIAAEAREGDVVLVMGARDPSLADFAQSILKALK